MKWIFLILFKLQRLAKFSHLARVPRKGDEDKHQIIQFHIPQAVIRIIQRWLFSSLFLFQPRWHRALNWFLSHLSSSGNDPLCHCESKLFLLGMLLLFQNCMIWLRYAFLYLELFKFSILFNQLLCIPYVSRRERCIKPNYLSVRKCIKKCIWLKWSMGMQLVIYNFVITLFYNVNLLGEWFCKVWTFVAKRSGPDNFTLSWNHCSQSIFKISIMLFKNNN